MAGVCGCQQPQETDAAARSAPANPSDPAGRVLVLPGIENVTFHLAGFLRDVRTRWPGYEVEARTWGRPLLGMHNLGAYDHNRQWAAAIAEDLAAWRRAHPQDFLGIVGFSGGGGIAVLVVEALPEDVTVDRLILVAPAISYDYPIKAAILPHVRGLMVNYSSPRDLQVGWGTRTFGTIDRKRVDSAGALGFSCTDPRLVQWTWSFQDIPNGHFGNHLSYLAHRWQHIYVMPALDPSLDADALKSAWQDAIAPADASPPQHEGSRRQRHADQQVCDLDRVSDHVHPPRAAVRQPSAPAGRHAE